jgi:glycosyltransferase involved in cell wall biosynthesis
MVIAIIPAYDEQEAIANVVIGVGCYVDQVVVVDDGSRDSTGLVAEHAGATVVTHKNNRGPGAATRTGIREALALGATFVVTIDGDGQHDPSDIPALLAPLREDRADIVFANRFGRSNEIPRMRRIFNWCANVLTFLTTGVWFADSQCGLKAFGPRALRELEITAKGFEFCTEIVREATRRSWRIAQVPSRVSYSAATLAKGQSFTRGLRTAWATLRATGR